MLYCKRLWRALFTWQVVQIAWIGVWSGGSATLRAEENATQIATVIRLLGKVKILAHPTTKVGNEGPYALYKDKYYQERDLKIGSKVDNGSIIRTAPQARVRLAYTNGDQFTLSESTHYQVSFNPEDNSPPLIDLLYGTLRGIILKDGPRSGTQVRSRTIAMGVRGTDFQIGANDTNGYAKVTVLRGRVTVRPTTGTKTNPITVSEGYSADIPLVYEEAAPVQEASAKPVEIVLRKTLKNELDEVRETSHIAPPSDEQIKVSSDEKLGEKLTKLEGMVKKATLLDIKQYDPAAYEQIQTSDLQDTDVDNLMDLAVQKNQLDAPEAPSRILPPQGQVLPPPRARKMSSYDNRSKKRWELFPFYGLDVWGGKTGLGGGYFLSENRVFNLTCGATAEQTFKGHLYGNSVLEFRQKFVAAAYRMFVGRRSFVISPFVQLAEMENISVDGSTSGSLGAIYQGGIGMALGNQWQWEHFSLGFDWFGVATNWTIDGASKLHRTELGKNIEKNLKYNITALQLRLGWAI